MGSAPAATATGKHVLSGLQRCKSACVGLDLLAAAMGRQSVAVVEPPRLHSRVFIPTSVLQRVPPEKRVLELEVDSNGISSFRPRCWAPRGMGMGACWACNCVTEIERVYQGLSQRELDALRSRAVQMELDDKIRATVSALPLKIPDQLRVDIAKFAFAQS